MKSTKQLAKEVREQIKNGAKREELADTIHAYNCAADEKRFRKQTGKAWG